MTILTFLYVFILCLIAMVYAQATLLWFMLRLHCSLNTKGQIARLWQYICLAIHDQQMSELVLLN